MKVDIIFKDYDENNIFVCFMRDNKNLHLEFGMCSFENEMEYWDMPTVSVEFEGEYGYLFDKNIPRKELIMEFERFITHYNLDKPL